MSTHTNRLFTHSPRNLAKASYDHIMSQQIVDDDEQATDRQFGPVAGLVIAAAASVPLWMGIIWLAGFFVGRLLP